MSGNLIKTLLSVGVLVGTLALGRVIVRGPYLQNQALRPMIYTDDLPSVAQARRHLSHLTSLGRWDPYLIGYRDLAIARGYRALNDPGSARHHYREAVGGRVPPEYWIEVGLYEMSNDHYDQGSSLILRALSSDPRLITEIADYGMRSEIRAIARRKGFGLR